MISSGRKHNETQSQEAYELKTVEKMAYCLDLGLYGNCKGTRSTELKELICDSLRKAADMNSSCLREERAISQSRGGTKGPRVERDQIPHLNPLGTICAHWHLNFKLPLPGKAQR